MEVIRGWVIRGEKSESPARDFLEERSIVGAELANDVTSPMVQMEANTPRRSLREATP